VTTPDPPAHHAFPWARIGVIVLVVATVVAGIWVGIREFGDGDSSDDPPPPTVFSPESSPAGTPSTATPSGGATPGVSDERSWPLGSLPHMLSLAPDRLADDSLPLNDVARYADIAGWMAACGISTPQSLDDAGLPAWEAQLDNLAIPTSLRERGLDPVWRQTYGFDLTQVEQVLIIGQAPDYVTVMRGAFDADELQTAWVTSGYQAVEIERQTIWSLAPGDAIDLTAPESRPAMGTLNNVVMLENGMLIASAKLSRLGSVLEVVNGEAPSLAEHDDVAAFLIPDVGVKRLASAVISKGSLVQGTVLTMPTAMSTPLAASPEVDGGATPESEPVMPEVNLVLLGIPLENAANLTTTVPQSGSLAAITVIVVFDELEDARRANVEIAARLDAGVSPVTQQPYSDRLPHTTSSVTGADDRSVVVVVGDLTGGAGNWLGMIGDRDLGFLYWLPEE